LEEKGLERKLVRIKVDFIQIFDIHVIRLIFSMVFFLFVSFAYISIKNI